VVALGTGLVITLSRKGKDLENLIGDESEKGGGENEGEGEDEDKEDFDACGCSTCDTEVPE
jgi:hypothetical protein